MKIEFTRSTVKASQIYLGESFTYADKTYTRVRLMGDQHDFVYGLDSVSGVDIIEIGPDTEVLFESGKAPKMMDFSDLDPGDCFMIQFIETVFMKILSQGAPAALCLESGRVQPTTIHINGSNQDIYGIKIIPVQITGMVTPGEK